MVDLVLDKHGGATWWPAPGSVLASEASLHSGQTMSFKRHVMHWGPKMNFSPEIILEKKLLYTQCSISLIVTNHIKRLEKSTRIRLSNLFIPIQVSRGLSGR